MRPKFDLKGARQSNTSVKGDKYIKTDDVQGEKCRTN